MRSTGHAVLSLETATWTTATDGTDHASVTAALEATELAVDAYRLGRGGTVQLDADREHLLVPLDATDPLSLSGGTVVGPGSLARLPAGVGETIECPSPATVVVVSVTTDPEPDARLIALSREDWAFVVPATSDVATAFLTGPLGCVGMKVNVRRLDPGQVVPYHTEGDQEELFVPVDGPAAMRIDGRAYRTPPGTVVRVAPAVPRSAINDGDGPAYWVMVGAPPTGGPTDWDPGAEILE